MPNLSDKAILVQLKISQWSGTTLDRKIAQEVARTYEFEKDDGEDQYFKRLVPKIALKPIRRSAGRLRTAHYAFTAPWQDNAVRILATKLFLEYQKVISKLRGEMEENVKEFAIAYPDWIAAMERSKKKVFNRGEYPPQDEIAGLFGARLQVLPFPNTDDFRNPELKQQADESIQEVLSSIPEHLLSRLQARLKKLHEVLMDPEATFHKSTLEKATETADFIQHMNVTDNERVKIAGQMVQNILAPLTPENLRTNPILRARVAGEVSEMMEAIEV